MVGKSPIAVIVVLALASAAHAQYVPIPNETSGPQCPGSIDQCSGFKIRSDINNKFSALGASDCQWTVNGWFQCTRINGVPILTGAPTPPTPPTPPGGAVGQAQFNKGSAFGGAAGLLFNLSTGNVSSITALGPTSITGTQTNGNDRISKLCINGVCPVTAFGAVADSGVTDNAPPIQSALTAACTGHNSVYFPASPTGQQYQTLSPLIDSCATTVPIFGDSFNNTILHPLFGHFAGIIHYPTTYLSDLGTFTGPSLVSGSTTSLNFPAPQTFVVNLQDALMVAGTGAKNQRPLNGITGFTWDGWVNWAPTGGHDANNIYALWGVGGSDGANPNAGAQVIADALRIVGNGSVAGTLQFVLNIAGTTNTVSVATAVTKNVSHYIRAVLDPNSGTPKMCVYVDGTQVGSVLTVTGGTTIQQLADTTMSLGGYGITGDQWPDATPHTDAPFYGQMFPVRIIGSALNACSAATVTVPTAPLANSGNDAIFLNNGVSGSFGTPNVPGAPVIRNEINASFPGYTLLRGGTTQGDAMEVHDLFVQNGSVGIQDVLAPQSHFRDLHFSGNQFIGLELWNNSYLSQGTNISCTSTNICAGTLKATFATFYNFLENGGGLYDLVGDDGGYIYGGIASPSSNTVASLRLEQASEFSRWLVSGFAVDFENGGNSIPLKMVGQPTGNFEFDSFDAQMAASQPAMYYNNNAGGSGTAGSASITFNNLQVEATTPTELVHFLGGSTNPVTLINPTVNAVAWSANTVPATTTEPLSLINIYADQGPVTAQRGYNFVYSGSGANAIPAAATANAHQRACVSDAGACTSGTTYSAGGGSVACEVWSNGSNWIESGSGC